MADFGNLRELKGIKDHRCEYCFGLIPKGEPHKQYKGMFDGEWQNWRMHLECYADYGSDKDAMLDGFMPGEAEKPLRVKLLEAGAVTHG